MSSAAGSFGERLEFFLVAYLAVFFLGIALVVSIGGGMSTSKTVRVYIDVETGCQYVGPRNTRELTPRMNAEGQQICETMEETE